MDTNITSLCAGSDLFYPLFDGLSMLFVFSAPCHCQQYGNIYVEDDIKFWHNRSFHWEEHQV